QNGQFVHPSGLLSANYPVSFSILYSPSLPANEHAASMLKWRGRPRTPQPVEPARSAYSMTKTYLDAAIEIAQEAAKILREEFDRPPNIVYKGDADLVTQADKRSERAIVERLTKYFPDHGIAAEEGTGHEGNSEFRWHVDPLDGTTNFAHGYPCFCVSIALAERDTIL